MKYPVPTENKVLFNCGNAYPHEGVCLVKGKEYRWCGKMNHFTKDFFSGRKQQAIGRG